VQQFQQNAGTGVVFRTVCEVPILLCVKPMGGKKFPQLIGAKSSGQLPPPGIFSPPMDHLCSPPPAA